MVIRVDSGIFAELLYQVLLSRSSRKFSTALQWLGWNVDSDTLNSLCFSLTEIQTQIYTIQISASISLSAAAIHSACNTKVRSKTRRYCERNQAMELILSIAGFTHSKVVKGASTYLLKFKIPRV